LTLTGIVGVTGSVWSATPDDRGATYHALEGRATSVTTTFPDAVAIADRAPDGHLSTRLTDRAGNELVRLRVDRGDAATDSLEFTLAGRQARRAAGLPAMHPTLDWSSEQAYSLWKDRDALDHASLEWQDTLMRPVGARQRNVKGEAVQTDTVWLDGFSATVSRKIGTHTSYLTGRQTQGLVFISRFKKDGVEIGSSQWWPDEQAFAWSFPGLTEGQIDATRLKRIGGWTFTPDMAWMNMQGLAFYQFHTAANARRSVSEKRPGWLERLGRLMMPAVAANEPGCDDLHWLDGSLYRPCCDDHDRCYARQDPVCSSSSWWIFWSSWSCTECNMMAAICFATGGSHIYQRYP
jgi:hypothetical protein